MTLRLRDKLPAFDQVSQWVNGSMSREELLGAPVLVHFWAVSCHLCKEEFPIVNHWRLVYGQQYGLQIIGVHAPRTSVDHNANAQATAAEYELEHPIILDEQLSLSRAFDNSFVPAYYVFDSQLELRYYQAGERGLHTVNQRLRRLLDVANSNT